MPDMGVATHPPVPGERLSRKERQLLSVIDCQGDDVDVVAAAQDLGISQNNLRAKVKAIRVKLQAPAADYWLEDLPALAREKGERLDQCGPPELPDDGSTRINGSV